MEIDNIPAISSVNIQNFAIENMIYTKISITIQNSESLTDSLMVPLNRLEIIADFSGIFNYVSPLTNETVIFVNGYDDTDKFEIKSEKGYVIASQTQALSFLPKSVVFRMSFKIQDGVPTNTKLGIQGGSKIVVKTPKSFITYHPYNMSE